jgi:hypothetical protein
MRARGTVLIHELRHGSFTSRTLTASRKLMGSQRKKNRDSSHPTPDVRLRHFD